MLREPGDDTEDVATVHRLEEAARLRELAKVEAELKDLREQLSDTRPRTAYQLEVAKVELELEKRLGSYVAERPTSWTKVDELLGMDFPAADWLINGLVAKDTLTIIGADPKATKTWTLLELAIAVATGGKAFGEFRAPVPGPVLLFLNEDTQRSIRNRFRALAAGHGLDPTELRRIAVRTREPLDVTNRRQLAKLIVDVRMAPERPALIGLDPLRNLHSAEENSSTEMSAVMRSLATLRDLCGCSLAVVHHSAKQGESARSGGSRMRGSSAIDGARDGLISLDGTEKESGGAEIVNQVAVDLKAHRSAGRFALTLRIEDDEEGEAIRATWERSEAKEKKAKKKESAPESKGTREQVAVEALKLMRQRHAAAVKAGQLPIFARGALINDLMSFTGASIGTVKRALKWLTDSEKLVEEPAPTKHRDADGSAPRLVLRLADHAVKTPEDDS